MRTKMLTLLVISLSMAMLWGCGSNRDSSGSVVGGGDTLAGAQTLGIDNCLKCHNVNTVETANWLASRHGNDNASPNTTDTDCTPCHDPLGDGLILDQADVTLTNRSVIGCESCHGGGQFHNGIAAGIPYPAPGVDQCTECHYVTEANVQHDIPDLSINDTHNGTAGDYTGSRNANVKDIDGLSIDLTDQGACANCHNAHAFDLTINLQWFASPHNEPAAAAAWAHYNWSERASCQRCHTTSGLAAFLDADIQGTTYTPPLAADAAYVPETLYCNGCHTDNEGTMRNPGELTLDFDYLVGPDQDPAGEPMPVVLPDKGDSNVCAACHSGRGNDTSIRDSYAAAAAEPLPADRGLSSRFAGHHAPTAGSLYAAVTHTGFEFTDSLGAVLDYSTPDLEHDQIDEGADGPCVSCHMGGPDHPNHTFEAVTEVAGVITVINNQALCNDCHGAMTPAALNTLRAEFAAARQILLNLVGNTVGFNNYLGLDISATANRNTDTLALNDFGAFQNSLYVTEEPCIYLHNSLYAMRLIFDSIDWLEDGALDGTIADYGVADDWLGGTTRP